jgi:hypothetical protein
MASDTSCKNPEPDLADLMTAVAVGRDRVAFAQLFDHFAARVKAYVKPPGRRQQDGPGPDQLPPRLETYAW